MSDGITLAIAQTKVAECLAAEAAVLSGAQSYTIGNRALSRAQLSEIASRLTFWRGEVARLQAQADGDTGGGIMTASFS